MILNCLTALALAMAAVAWVGCGGDTGPGRGTGLAISGGTTQLADIARNVGGDRATVNGILDANSDPHDYEPKPSDVEGVADADLILRSGGDLDLWLDQIIESSGSDAPVITLIDEVDAIEGVEDGETGTDPHWWQNPLNAIAAVEALRDELVELDPDGERVYEANAAAYIAELEQLDTEIAACVDAVPAEQRKLVTSHDALGYYADRYGIDVIGAAIPALITQAQPSAGETAQLVDTIRSASVSTIFPEAGVSAELESVIAEEAGASVGGELWADALGPEGSDGATYVESLESNTAKLVEGFTDGEQSCSISVEEK